ncbi:hypothetical protein NMG60_11021310 [Bertholletia excelsa]
MGLSKASLALLSLLLALSLCSAQNRPEDYLRVHNNARGAVKVGPLVWDDKLATYALNYARTHVGDCKLVHSGGPYGENLAAGSGEFTAVDAVKLWVNESKYYDYNSNSCVGGVCGHYTQVVWRNSKRVGCARVQCTSGWWWVICSYDPPGNVVGQRPY